MNPDARARDWLWKVHHAFARMDNKATYIALAHLGEWSVGPSDRPTTPESKQAVNVFLRHLKEEAR